MGSRHRHEAFSPRRGLGNHHGAPGLRRRHSAAHRARPRVTSWPANTWRSVLFLGLSLGAMNSFFYASLEHTPLGIAVTVEFLGPLLLAAALSRRPLDLLWAFIAFLGIGLLGKDAFLSSNDLSVTGLCLALVAGGFWICYILASSTVGAKAPGLDGLAVAIALGTLVPLPAGAHGAGILLGDPTLLILALFTGLLGSVIPYALQMGALRRMPREVFGILLSLEPAFAAVIGWLVLGQALGAGQWLAVALVISASVGTTMGSRRSRNNV